MTRPCPGPDYDIRTPKLKPPAGACDTQAHVFGPASRFPYADGRGYTFVTDVVLRLDEINPQIASRIVSAFNSWRRFDEARQARMRAGLEAIASKDGLSRDVFEVVQKSLQG